MKTHHVTVNPFRNAVELYAGAGMLLGGAVLWRFPHWFLLSGVYLAGFEGMLLVWAGRRFYQGWQVLRFQKRLLHIKAFALSTREVPLLRHTFYVGVGFPWGVQEAQYRQFITELDNQRYHTVSTTYKKARHYEETHHNRLTQFTRSQQWLNPVKPLPPVGGKPWLHGLGESEAPVGVKHSERFGHLFIQGATRVGKTRLLSVLVNQDIRAGEAVIFLDPKGDLEILQDMYAACAAVDRLDDFNIVHVGFPALSAKLNTLSSYVDISDVASRVTAAMETSGEGAQFRDFAWKYVNITAKCLEALGETISYQSISFYVTRPEVLLLAYADKVLPKTDPDYLAGVEETMAELEALAAAQGVTADIPRSMAIKRYLKQFIDTNVAAGNMQALVNDVIVPLYEASTLDETYFAKITASLGPALDMINQSNASGIFSFDADGPQPEVKLMEAIKRKQVIYIGLNSLSNLRVSTAVGKAIISDLVSCAGKIYNAAEKHTVSVYADEFAEIVQDEFITLLNKAGGSGFRITSATQTINDLIVGLNNNRDKAEMAKGNFQSSITLRVLNDDTAQAFIDRVDEVNVVSRTEGASTTDTPRGEEGVYFQTSNDVRLQHQSTPLLTPSDIKGLPKGQAFLHTNGGELYKVRLPLPKNDGLAPADFAELIETVNQGEQLWLV